MCSPEHVKTQSRIALVEVNVYRIQPLLHCFETQSTSWVMTAAAAAAAKSLQLCPTLCDPIDGSPPGSPVPGILQARTLEWVAISFSDAWKWKVKVKSLSRVWLLGTPWTAAHQAPLSMGEYWRQEYWSGVPLPSTSELASEMEEVGNKRHFSLCVFLNLKRQNVRT